MFLRITEGARCRLYGDPHVVSFDNRKFDYQGVCKYRLAEPCYDVGGVPNFQVINKNRFIGFTPKKSPLSQVKNVFVEVYGFKVVMLKDLVVTVSMILIKHPVLLHCFFENLETLYWSRWMNFRKSENICLQSG